MSARRSADQMAPRHRRNLSRQRKSLRMELRIGVYARLLELARDGEPLVETVERLIVQAKGCPAATGCTSGKTEYVHKRLEAVRAVA